MYSISNEYKIACKALTRQSRTKIVVDNITYNGAKYVKDYPKFSHVNETMIGGFPIKSAEFSLWNKDENINLINKPIKIYRGLVIDDNIEWIPQGVFYARKEDIKTSDTGEYITVKCYDGAKDLGTKIYNDTNSYPISESDYIKNVISQSGYELDTNCFVESNYMMQVKPNISNDTKSREIISRYAEQRGAIALFSREGKVQIKKPTAIDFSYKSYEYKRMICESLYGPLNQVAIGNKNYNNNITYPEGEQTFNWSINDNPFLDLIRQERVEEIYNQVKGLTLTPFTLESAIDSFLLDINDVITIQKKDKTYQNFTILSVKTENRLKCKIGANVQNKSNINYSLAGSTAEENKKLRLDVDYNTNKINALIETQDEHTTKITQLEMNDASITSTVSDMQKQIIDLSKYTDTKNGNEVEINNKIGNEIKVNSVVLKGRTETIITENIFDKDTMSSRINAFINANSKWAYAEDSYCIRIPVKPNTKLTINMDNTNESLFRFGYIKTDDIPTSTTQVDVYDVVRLTRPVPMPQEIFVGDDARYLIIQMGAGQAITTIESLSIKEEQLKSINGMKNLFDSEFENGIVNYITGNKSSNTTLIRAKNYIEVQPNANYKFSGIDYDYNSVLVYEYDKDLNFIQYLVNNEPSQHAINFSNYLTTTSNTKYILFRPPGVITNTNFKIQLEEGIVATEYAPKGQISLKINKKNLIDEKKAFKDSNITLTNGVFSSEVWRFGNRYIYFADYFVNKEITLSTLVKIDSNATDVRFIIYNSNDEIIFNSNYINNLTDFELTKISFIPPEKGCYARLQCTVGGNISVKNLMLNVGEYQEYEPYEEQKTYVDLQGNELTEYDKLFIENDRAIIQKKSRHLSLAIIDMNNSEDYPGWKNLTQLKEDFPSSNNYFSLITNYISNIGLMSDNRISINTNQTGVLFLSKYYNNNLTQTQWKEQHPSLVLDLYYELDTPYEIDLGQIEMPTILSNKNYFSNSEDANMSINYFTNYEMYQMYYENEKKFNELDSKTNDLANEGNEIRKDLNNNYTNNSELEQKLDNQKQEIKTEMSTTISQTKESWQAEVLEYINKNGVEKFVNMLVTIDIDGLKLSKSDEDIVSLLNNKGLYVSDGKLREDLSNLLMKVDRAGALFKILEILGTIKEQNIIQKEVIEDTKYGTCQAWYWIGGDN